MIRLILNAIGVFLACYIGMSQLANAGAVQNITVGLHQAELVALPKNMTRVIIADRKVAGVVKHSSRKVSVIGHGIGKTDIRIMSGSRIAKQINLTVTHDIASIKNSLNSLFPDEEIGLDIINESVALTGLVSSAEVASNVVKVVEEFTNAPSLDTKTNVLNLMKLRDNQQVMLRVRVGEIRRDALDNLGLGVQGVIRSGLSVLGALEKDRLFKVLAEPTLTAISGESAQFLAGGEFPVPVMQAGNTMSVDYKTFGVNINFTPYVLSKKRIRLDVSSEVSDLSNAGAVKVNSLNIPSVATSKATTTVELAPGESFMIAGLVKNTHLASNSGQFPLGDVPVLSALFRSSAFKNNESELVMAVTPYLVNPVDSKSITLPTDNVVQPTFSDALFFGKLEDQTAQPVANALEGQIDFQLD